MRKPILPDGYFRLTTPRGKTRFFLEVDRGTEELSRFTPQIRVYNAYTASGLYQERFQAASLRILIVSSSPRRMETLKTAVRQEGGDRKYWFTTFQQISADSVLTAPIWATLYDDGLQPLIALPC